MARFGTVWGVWALGASVLTGCFAQHGVDPLDPDGGPTDAGTGVWCVRLGTPGDGSRCCLEEQLVDGVTRRCDDLGATWEPGRCADYPRCRPVEPECPGDAPTCFRLDGAGRCTTVAEPATCDRGSLQWRCSGGWVPREECPSAGDCSGLRLDECISDDACVPVFDNACCPTCSPSLICTDCTDWQFERCLPRDEACDPAIDACWIPMDGACEGRPPTCDATDPTSERSCGLPGCIVQQSPPCADCIPTRTCVAHRGRASCEAVCLEVPVDCGTGWIPEADGGCFTGYCIPESACPLPAD